MARLKWNWAKNINNLQLGLPIGPHLTFLRVIKKVVYRNKRQNLDDLPDRKSHKIYNTLFLHISLLKTH